MYYIYIIINLINSKTYIGQHKINTKRTDHYLGSGTALHNAFNKYGKESFVKHIIDYADNKADIDALEKCYIAMFRALGKAEYNIADGGGGTCGVNVFANKSEDEMLAIKKHMSDSHLGERNSMFGKSAFTNKSEDEMLIIKKHMSDSHSGERNSMFGKSVYENLTIDEYNERCEKISKSTKVALNNLPPDIKYNQHKKIGKAISNYRKNISKDAEEQRYNKWKESYTKYCQSEEFKKRRSEQSCNIALGRIWCNNGIQERFVKEIPEGYVIGRLKKNKNNNLNKDS